MNRFAAFNDESDNEDKKPVASAPKDKKKAAPAAPAAAPAAPAAAAKAASEPKSAPKKDGDKKPRTPRPAGDGEKKPRAPRPQTAPAESAVADEGEFTELPVKGDGSGKNKHKTDSRRKPKGRLDGENPSIKPGNRRTGNYHTPSRRSPDAPSAGDVIQESEAAENDAVAEAVDEAAAAAAEEAVPEPEPEPVTISLDEYMRKREEARAASSLLAITKTARPVEESLAGLKVKSAGEEDAGVYTGVSKAKKGDKSAQRSTSKTVMTDLTFQGADEVAAEEHHTSNDRGSSRGNGSGRGGRGERFPRASGGGASRGAARGGAKIDIADKSAFPSL